VDAIFPTIFVVKGSQTSIVMIPLMNCLENLVYSALDYSKKIFWWATKKAFMCCPIFPRMVEALYSRLEIILPSFPQKPFGEPQYFALVS